MDTMAARRDMPRCAPATAGNDSEKSGEKVGIGGMPTSSWGDGQVNGIFSNLEYEFLCRKATAFHHPPRPLQKQLKKRDHDGLRHHHDALIIHSSPINTQYCYLTQPPHFNRVIHQNRRP
jgi:hypothetical protein